MEALTAKYDEVAAQLTALEEESAGIKTGLEQQKELIEQSLKDVEEAVTSVRGGEKKREEDMDTVKREVERIKDDLPRVRTQSFFEGWIQADLFAPRRCLRSTAMRRQAR